MENQEYSEYKKSVASFFKREGITNLSMECGEAEHECVICGEIVGCDPWFSWSSCECCGSRLGGNRYHTTGYHPESKQGLCYEVCVDCIYYAEYGKID